MAFPGELALTILTLVLLTLARAGMALFQTGFTRSKNAVTTLSMHLLSFAAAVLAYVAVGQVLRRHGISGSGFSHPPGDARMLRSLLEAVVLSFGIAVPIGALAERWGIRSFAYVTAALALVVFPVVGGGLLDGGWISHAIFKITGRAPVDFSGAGPVHLLGSLVAAAGVRALGPRLGKYHMGKPRALFGHDMPMVILGSFLFMAGFPGFALAFGQTDEAIAAAAGNDFLAAAAGVLAAALFMAWRYRKPDPSMIASAALAGLVSVSAAAQAFDPLVAVLAGAIGAVIMCVGIITLEGRNVDDPAGVLSIHGLCGAWALLVAGLAGHAPGARGLFMGDGRQFLAELLELLAVIAIGLPTAILIFRLARHAKAGHRVQSFVEVHGLDTHEMGLPAYPEFISAASERTQDAGFGGPY